MFESPYDIENDSVKFSFIQVSLSKHLPSQLNSKEKSTPLRLLTYLELSNFKIEACKIDEDHNHKKCQFYHNGKDRRRAGSHYSSSLCNYVIKGTTCPYKENCKMSHNKVEQLFRPEKLKVKFCTSYPNNLEDCEYGSHCCFAHSEEEIAIPLLQNFAYDDDFYMFHFKTVWCPFNLSYHDKSLCVYAHNWQDYRRKPSERDYNPEPCPFWDLKKFINFYDEGCHQGENCQFSHGWKELEYHPLVFKTGPCKLGSRCKDNRACPYFHTLSEKRLIPKAILFKILKFHPRNRIVEDTFKKNGNVDYSQRTFLSTFSNQLRRHYTGDSKMTIDTNEKHQNTEKMNYRKRNSLKNPEELAAINENRRKSVCGPSNNENSESAVKFHISNSHLPHSHNEEEESCSSYSE